MDKYRYFRIPNGPIERAVAYHADGINRSGMEEVLLGELLAKRDGEWAELPRNAHPSVLTQPQGEIALKRLLADQQGVGLSEYQHRPDLRFSVSRACACAGNRKEGSGLCDLCLTN